MCLCLADVRCCSDRERAGAFLARLFERFPGVLTCRVGVRLLAGVAHLPAPDEATVYAAMTVFRTRDDLPLDEPTLALFRRVEEHPDVLLRGDVDESFFDHLLDAFVIDPELVCRISEEAVRRRGAELR